MKSGNNLMTCLLRDYKVVFTRNLLHRIKMTGKLTSFSFLLQINCSKSIEYTTPIIFA